MRWSRARVCSRQASSGDGVDEVMVESGTRSPAARASRDRRSARLGSRHRRPRATALIRRLLACGRSRTSPVGGGTARDCALAPGSTRVDGPCRNPVDMLVSTARSGAVSSPMTGRPPTDLDRRFPRASDRRAAAQCAPPTQAAEGRCIHGHDRARRARCRWLGSRAIWLPTVDRVDRVRRPGQ